MIIVDPYEDPNECKCIFCGSHRCACSYPPICDDPGCAVEWEINLEFNEAMRRMEILHRKFN